MLYFITHHDQGPRLKNKEKDQVWMLIKNILKKLTPLEFTTENVVRVRHLLTLH